MWTCIVCKCDSGASVPFMGWGTTHSLGFRGAIGMGGLTPRGRGGEPGISNESSRSRTSSPADRDGSGRHARGSTPLGHRADARGKP
jgi:hypothetical protein